MKVETIVKYSEKSINYNYNGTDSLNIQGETSRPLDGSVGLNVYTMHRLEDPLAGPNV